MVFEAASREIGGRSTNSLKGWLKWLNKLSVSKKKAEHDSEWSGSNWSIEIMKTAKHLGIVLVKEMEIQAHTKYITDNLWSVVSSGWGLDRRKIFCTNKKGMRKELSSRCILKDCF